MDSGNSKFVLHVALSPSFLLLTHYSCTVCPCGTCVSVDARCCAVLEMLFIIYLLSARLLSCCFIVKLCTCLAHCWAALYPVLQNEISPYYFNRSCTAKLCTKLRCILQKFCFDISRLLLASNLRQRLCLLSVTAADLLNIQHVTVE